MLRELPGKDADELTLIVSDLEIKVESGTFVRDLTTGADGFTAVIPWEPGADKKLDKITAPFSYAQAGIYIGGKLQSEMILYDVTQKTDTRSEKTLEFWTKTADIIDSTLIAPYEANNIKLTDRCKQQCNPFGINVIVGDDAAKKLLETKKITYTDPKARQFNVAASTYNVLHLRPIIKKVPDTFSKFVTDEKKFPRVKGEPTDTIFKHLAELAAQRGLLLTCTTTGDLLITMANVNSKPVGTIEEGKYQLAPGYVASWKGRDRFALYRAMVQSSGSKKAKAVQIAEDKVVKAVAPRILTFNADESLPGEAKSAAEWRRNKTAADAMSFTFPVNSWYAPDGTLWIPNTTVTIISPTMGVKNGFTFLIRAVKLEYKSGGTTGELDLVPPSVFTTGEISEPWLA